MPLSLIRWLAAALVGAVTALAHFGSTRSSPEHRLCSQLRGAHRVGASRPERGPNVAGIPPADTVAGGESAVKAISLTAVTVSLTGSKLCGDFHAKGALVNNTFYELYLAGEESGPGGTPGVTLQAVRSDGETTVALRYPGDEESPGGIYVRAETSSTRGVTSVLIDRSVFPRWWRFTRFTFYADGVAPGAPGALFQQYSVTVPTRPARFP